MIETPIKQLLTPMLNLFVIKDGGDIAPVEGVLLTSFDSTSPTYIKFPEELTFPLGVEWEIEIYTVLPVTGAYHAALTTSSEGEDRFGFIQDGRVFLPTTSSDNIGGNITSYLGSTKLHKVTVGNTKVNVYYRINDTQMYATNNGTSAPVLDSIGKVYAGSTGVPSMSGHIVAARVIIDGEVLVDIKLDKDYTMSPIIENRGKLGNCTLVNPVTPTLFTENDTNFTSSSTTLTKEYDETTLDIKGELGDGIIWSNPAVDYQTLENATLATISLDLAIADVTTARGVIMEQGGEAYGMAIWVDSGVLTCKVGGTSSTDTEVSYPLRDGRQQVDVIINVNDKMSLFVDGILQHFKPLAISKMAGTDEGGIMDVHSDLVPNDFGWDEFSTDSAFTDTLISCEVWTQVPTGY